MMLKYTMYGGAHEVVPCARYYASDEIKLDETGRKFSMKKDVSIVHKITVEKPERERPFKRHRRTN
jgi:hypothetical protein